MEEYLDILDKTGKPLGESYLKSVVHQKGYYHNTVHIWFYTREGQILLAQRSFKKTICPGMWDVSVAGHVDAGETLEAAAVREIREEIGLKIHSEDLEKIGVFECFEEYSFGVSDNEFHHTYLSELKSSLENLTPDPGEVEAIKLVSVDTFLDKLEESEKNDHFVATNKPYYLTVLSYIKTKFADKK
ncbi:MAG: NUDIX domain-containing protein [Mangrovimonas sp.]|nr:NUDIX domain-containing protein [Mangrovimonas sp.]